MKVIQRISTFEATLTSLQGEIASGRWPVGERIPSEAVLTKELGVSRASLREAVRALVHSGMLQSRQGAGTYVMSRQAVDPLFTRNISTAERNHIVEVRRGLDVIAVKLAAMRRTPADLKKLSCLLSARSDAAKAENNDEFISADLAFHKTIVDASHNPLLIDMYQKFVEALEESLRGSQCMVVSQIGLDPYHQKIFDAIEAQDEAAAIKATQSLLDLDEFT